MNRSYLLVGVFLLIVVVLSLKSFPKSKEITNFEECARAMNIVMETYPRQCRTKDGILFVEKIVSESIMVSSPVEGELVESSFVVRGKARGTWYFEGSFPALLYDANGKQLFAGPVTAKAEWMTENFVPFEGTITFDKPQTKWGTLVLKKDNPSGDLAKDQEISIKVKFE